MEDGSYSRTKFNIGPYGKCLKTFPLWNQTAQEWSLEGPLQNFSFLPIGNPRWPPLQEID